MPDLQPDRPHELEHFLHDGVGHLGLVDDVGQHRLRVRCVRNLAAQQPGHDFDPGERVLDLVGDGRSHLAERGKAVAQSLTLLELLDAREILEEHRRADNAACIVADERERVAEHLSGRTQPQFRSIR